MRRLDQLAMEAARELTAPGTSTILQIGMSIFVSQWQEAAQVRAAGLFLW
jgi:hypothetical protein